MTKTIDYGKMNGISARGISNPFFDIVGLAVAIVVVPLLVDTSLWSFRQTELFFLMVFPETTINVISTIMFGDVQFSFILSVIFQYGQQGFLFVWTAFRVQEWRLMTQLRSVKLSSEARSNLEEERTKSASGIKIWRGIFVFSIMVDAVTNIGEFLTEYAKHLSTNSIEFGFWNFMLVLLGIVVAGAVTFVEEGIPMFLVLGGTSFNNILEAIGWGRIGLIDVAIQALDQGADFRRKRPKTKPRPFTPAKPKSQTPFTEQVEEKKDPFEDFTAFGEHAQ